VRTSCTGVQLAADRMLSARTHSCVTTASVYVRVGDPWPSGVATISSCKPDRRQGKVNGFPLDLARIQEQRGRCTQVSPWKALWIASAYPSEVAGRFNTKQCSLPAAGTLWEP